MPASRAAWAEVAVTGDDGVAVRLDKPADRVIALSGALAECLMALEAGELLVARTDADADLAGLADKPSVGTHMRPNLELVLGASPDLIVQLAGRKEALESVETLRRLGLPVLVLSIASFKELFAAEERLGALTGRENQARTLAAAQRGRLERLERLTADAARRPRVFFEIRHPNLLGAGGNTMADAVIRAAAGENVLADRERLVRLSEEELLRLAPEVYLVQRGPMNENPVPPDQRPHFRELAAVRDGRVYAVDERRYSRPGPRALEAAEELAALLHPERFATNGPQPAGETR